MRRLAMATLVLATALPAGASAADLDLRIGAFFPRADSNLFQDDVALYNVDKSDFRGVAGGVQLNVRLAPNLAMGFHIDGYGRSIDTSYRDYVRSDGREIRQTLKLDIVPVGVALRLGPTGHHARLAPYAEVGLDAFFWNYEEFGDFIDFEDPELTIVPDHFKSDGVTPGVHVAGGLAVPLGYDFSLVGEVRYQLAKDNDMGGDFFRASDKNKLDLSGTSATLGINIKF